MNKRKVVITGLGVIAPNGVGKEEFWEAIKSGKTGVKPITRFDVSDLPSKTAGKIDNFVPTKYIDPKKIKHMDRFAQFAVAAAKMAVIDANLIIKKENSNRIGVFIGTSIGGQGWLLKQFRILLEKGPDKVSPFTAVATFPEACAGNISIEFGINGPSFVISSGSAAGFDAIIIAMEYINNGLLDVVIAGGTDAPLYREIFVALCKMKGVISTSNDIPIKTPRPFDKRRDGMVLSEGAGIIILESLEFAIKRKANIYAELAGYGRTCTARHMANPDMSGEQGCLAVINALESAKISSSEIGFIDADGLSIDLNDKNEALILNKVFKNEIKNIPVTAIKSMIGHPMAAAAVIKLISATLAINEGIVPPTINSDRPEEALNLNLVLNKPIKITKRIALSNCFAFGGNNSALIIKK